MTVSYAAVTLQLVAALAAGSLIGIERTYHGRPAGFRTHALVCLASALLMQVTVHEPLWLTGIAPETLRMDPTRMAQGVMTGIGFLGAGVIFKEGLTVRGLTTAASIWITAALGVMFGTGFWFPAVLATAFVLGTLAVFRMFENRFPAQAYASVMLRFPRDRTPDESDIRALLTAHGFEVLGMNYRLVEDGAAFEYETRIVAIDHALAGRLAESLRGRDDLLEFRIASTAD